MGQQSGELAGKRVLIIDDHPETVSPLKRLLEEVGCRTKLVCDGYDAINELIVRHYDLLVLDWMMPGMGGMQTLLKADGYVSFDPTMTENWPWKTKIPVAIYSSVKPNMTSLRELENFKVVEVFSKAQKVRSIVEEFSKRLQTV